MKTGIGVGINENIYISAVELDSNNYLTITLKQKTDLVNPYDKLIADEVIEGSDKLDIKLFAPQPPKNDDGKLTEEKLLDRVSRDINKNKGILQHIMKGYMTKDQYTFGKAIFDGIDIDPNTYATKILDKDVLLKVHQNMSQFFINAMQAYLNKDELLFRCLLVRTSKDKHFSTFRSQYVEDNPFWESMDVPQEASKVKFTPYEEKEGLNDGTPASRSETSDNKKTTESTVAMSAASVFGQ